MKKRKRKKEMRQASVVYQFFCTYGHFCLLRVIVMNRSNVYRKWIIAVECRERRNYRQKFCHLSYQIDIELYTTAATATTLYKMCSILNEKMEIDIHKFSSFRTNTFCYWRILLLLTQHLWLLIYNVVIRLLLRVFCNINQFLIFNMEIIIE